MPVELRRKMRTARIGLSGLIRDRPELSILGASRFYTGQKPKYDVRLD